MGKVSSVVSWNSMGSDLKLKRQNQWNFRFQKKTVQWYLEEGKSQTSQVLKENSDISDFKCYQIDQFVQTQVYLTVFNQCYLANVMVLWLILTEISQKYWTSPKVVKKVWKKCEKTAPVPFFQHLHQHSTKKVANFAFILSLNFLHQWCYMLGRSQ